MESQSRHAEQRNENSRVSRITGPLRRFGENLTEQVRLRAKYGAAIAATLVTTAQAPAPALAGGRSFAGDVGNAEEPPHVGEQAPAASPQSEIPLEFPPLVPVGPKSKAKAGWNLYLVWPNGKEANILEPSILSLKTDPCVDCVVELRCRGPKVREELDPPPQIFRVTKGEGKKKKRVIKVEETLAAKVSAMRGKTTTFGCEGEDFEDPESPGGWQVFVPTLVTPPMPPEETVSESAPLPTIEAIPPLPAATPPAATPPPEPPQVFLARADRPDEVVPGDELALPRNPQLFRVDARCPEGAEIHIVETSPLLGSDLHFDPDRKNYLSVPLAPLEKMVVRCGDGPPRTITITRAAAPEATPAEKAGKLWSVEAGATLPTASTDNLFPLEPGAFVRTRRKFGNHIGASAGVSWNPVRQGLTRRHIEFVPLNANQRLRGNAFRVTAGPFATGRVPLSNISHMDFHAGINVGANISSVGSARGVAVDRDGQLADMPYQRLAAPVAEMCGSVSFGVRERLSGVLGACTGTSIGRFQTEAADPNGKVLTFVEPMGGARVEF